MAQEAIGADGVPQRGVLLRRAHQLLDDRGQPTSESLLIEHLFGVAGESGRSALWANLLYQVIQDSPLFEQTGTNEWSLTAWRSTQLLLNEAEYVALDVETTGLRPGPDRVIEIACLRLRNGQIVDSFQTLVNPLRRLPPFIVQLTGITHEMVAKAPLAEQILPTFLSFIEGATIVGHNVSFDIGFLTYEAQLLGQTFPIDGLDTIALARRLLPGLRRFKLDMVAQHLNIPASNRHRAMGDTRVTAAIFLKLLDYAQEQGIQTLGHLRRRLQLPVQWSGDIADVAVTKQLDQWGINGKKYNDAPRPNGGLLLNPAWKRDFPAKPGVYLMKDANQQVIYVGKAKSLKDRLASYYSHPLGYTRKMDGLLQSVREIETRILGSELEALLVESQLIKQLQPAYNVQLRNYELYPFIKIDVQHPFPRIYATREVTADGARYFGPFRSRRVVDITLELIQKVFPIRTCTRSLPPHAPPSNPCLRLHLGRCPAPCTGKAEPAAYAEVIVEVCAFLGGEREDLLDRLRRQMLEASQQMNYERAAWLRDTIHSADEVLIGQRLITGAVEANNLLIAYPSAREDHNELFLIRHGRLVAQRCTPHDADAMRATVLELIACASSLGEPPSIVGKAEVDQINIISRWIHRHSDDRAFFPLQAALSDAVQAQQLTERIWTEIDTVRSLPVETAEDDRYAG
ncbi:MAG TPA: exonuclease domain-containing protein [Ktedonobacteraceae bacterium]|nr:exonuclease domain-containing protein [Ktedonobacteraceae bacterium]